MEQILRIFFNNGSFITFAGLQLLCVYLIINFNSKQGEIAAETWSVRAGSVKSVVGTFQDYLDLREENEIQQAEIANLRSQLENALYDTKAGVDSIDDQRYQQRFRLLATNVVNRSPFKPTNTCVIDRGTAFGVQPGQGVVGEHGLVGIVDLPTANYARVISILNRAARISAGLRNDAFGTLLWEGKDPRRMTLTDIPDFMTVVVGDTVFTTGYSNVFPTGVVIGTVESSAEQPGTGSQDLVVRLINEPLHARNAFVVQDLLKEEITSLNNNRR